jgi:hypothetical protein
MHLQDALCDQKPKRLAKGIGAYGCGEDSLRA